MLTFSAIILYAWSILSLVAFKVADWKSREDRIGANTILFFGFLSMIAGSALLARAIG